MAGPDSGRRSGRKSKGKGQTAKRRAPTGNAPQNNQTKERTQNQLPKLERDPPIEKLPSNSPTMAIAPSDYEHIFHEATGVIGQGRDNANRAGNNFNKQPPASPPNLVQVSPPPPAQQLPNRYTRSPEPAQNYNNAFSPGGSNIRGPPDMLMVSPDGYTMLGQQPLPEGSSHRRVALPAYIVRASNQFSRAALARVSKYLASRADPPR